MFFYEHNAQKLPGAIPGHLQRCREFGEKEAIGPIIKVLGVYCRMTVLAFKLHLN